jgi:hypothetical protein
MLSPAIPDSSEYQHLLYDFSPGLGATMQEVFAEYFNVSSVEIREAERVRGTAALHIIANDPVNAAKVGWGMGAYESSKEYWHEQAAKARHSGGTLILKDDIPYLFGMLVEAGYLAPGRYMMIC